ncbi:MAG: HAMP domain-containing histidine kinase [Bradyrhizobium sp.]|nr:HAMP domain-containing histidine kinase [Bradyrhizobium sp.]MBV9982840.1 HAMP domain-containing histidine kinase [Bradyrhizobium sp.]
MHSLRSRLLALWVMLVLSGSATAYLLFESFQQSAQARVARSEERAARACRDISDRFRPVVSTWSGSPIDEPRKSELASIVQAALASANGVEGGIWRDGVGSLAYAFPTYEGTGPKTDVPAAESATITEVNRQALLTGKPAAISQGGRSQVLLVEACPLPASPPGLTAWTMTRVFTSEGPGYGQLLAGLMLIALTIFGSAIWLARLLYAWSRKIALVETALEAADQGAADLPNLPPTGERELDRLVDALNATGERLSLERRRAAAAERLAAVGRFSAGLAHEIRNPIAAMRLKAENALASADASRKDGALKTILGQIDRLDGLLRDLLEMTQSRPPDVKAIDLGAFLQAVVHMHRDLAASKNIRLELGTCGPSSPLPRFDSFQMQRAMDNLILNAIQNSPDGGAITVDAYRDGEKLVLRVSDNGPGVGDEIREKLFEPFVTGRPDGTGLGLALVREIARNHGGGARLVSTAQGACFEIELPWRSS